MQILVFNLGSTSLKYKLFAINADKTRTDADRGGIILKLLKRGEFNDLGESKKMNHTEAIRTAIRKIGNLTDIKAIGHRVVHGGNEFIAPTLISPTVLKSLEKYNNLAPLHNPYNLLGIRNCLIYFGNIPNIAVFDTAYFRSLPLKTKIYPIPFEFYKNFGIERFGFHGISHQYVAEIAAKKLKKPLEKLKLITCHLGGGCSITAIKNGKPIDTSTGFTPLEGLVMMTRPGDIDPGIILEIQKNILLQTTSPGLTDPTKIHKLEMEIIDKTKEILNSESGIKGICGIDNYLKLLKNIKKYPRVKLAFDIFVYRIQKYISAYWGILGGVNAIIFTGKIGVGQSITRRAICKDLKFLGRTKILAIPTDEELAIAKECLKILRI
ncbi:MAG: acetate/propionate family kinase [Patescibacteria group bacterium]